jgi:hypothetical protein
MNTEKENADTDKRRVSLELETYFSGQLEYMPYNQNKYI